MAWWVPDLRRWVQSMSKNPEDTVPGTVSIIMMGHDGTATCSIQAYRKPVAAVLASRACDTTVYM